MVQVYSESQHISLEENIMTITDFESLTEEEKAAILEKLKVADLATCAACHV